MFGWRRARNSIQTDAYSLRVQQLGREFGEVIFADASGELRFEAGIYGKKARSISISVTPSISGERMTRILPELEDGLRRFGLSYVIYREGDYEQVPAEEHANAMAEFRAMGLQAEVSQDQTRVKLSKLPGNVKPKGIDARERALRMMQLVGAARGKRRTITILAKSALADSQLQETRSP